jgi:putative tricarboxylic transport membrane protein
MRVSDTVAGIVLIAIAAAMIYLTLSFPPFPGQKFGPALFPRILGSGLILCALLLIARHLRATNRTPAFALSPWAGEPWRVGAFVLVPAVTLTYILVSEWVGFIPTAFALLAVLFLWFGVRTIVALPLAIAATMIIHWFFGTMMRVPLPRGLLTNIL